MTTPPPRGTAHALHVLVAHLDRSADRILRAELDLSYPRFLVLITLHTQGPLTQRALAASLGLTEPTVSRSVLALADDGLLQVLTVAGQGNRRSVQLTPSGADLVDRGAARLEAAFAELTEAAGVDRDTLTAVTEQLIRTLGGPS